MKVVGIIQARMGSTRLKDKMTFSLLGKPFIQFVYDQVSKSQLCDELYVAIPDTGQNKELEDILIQQQIPYVKGSEYDVLGRYCDALDDIQADVIVRFTGDNPFTDYELTDALIRQFLEKKVDYMCSKFIPKMPRGIGVEIISATLLRKLNEIVTDEKEREHVTAHILNNIDSFSLAKFEFQVPDEYPDYFSVRATVDTKEDQDLVTSVLNELGDRPITWKSLFEVLMAHPEILEVNDTIAPKKDVGKYYSLSALFST